MGATSPCDFQDNKAIYHYQCQNTATGAITNGTLPWCTADTAPFAEDLQHAVRVKAFSDMSPDESTTSMPEQDIKCQMLMVPLAPGVSEQEKVRRSAVARGYASNCAPAFDANLASMRNEYTCFYSGGITDDEGRRGTHPFKRVSGTIHSCDMRPEVSDELMEDVKLAAYMASGGDRAELDVNGFACSIMSLPH